MARIKIEDLSVTKEISANQMKQITGTGSGLNRFASISYLESLDARSLLNSLANRQRSILAQKQAIRDVQSEYDKFRE